MSQPLALELSPEDRARVAVLAEARGTTADELLRSWIEERATQEFAAVERARRAAGTWINTLTAQRGE